MKLPSKPLEKFLRRIGPASAEGNQQLLDHRLQVLGKFQEAFTTLKNNALDRATTTLEEGRAIVSRSIRPSNRRIRANLVGVQ